MFYVTKRLKIIGHPIEVGMSWGNRVSVQGE